MSAAPISQANLVAALRVDDEVTQMLFVSSCARFKKFKEPWYSVASHNVFSIISLAASRFAEVEAASTAASRYVLMGDGDAAAAAVDVGSTEVNGVPTKRVHSLEMVGESSVHFL